MNNNDWVNDIEEKAYINAIFKNGQFIDTETNKLIFLKENTRVKISIPIWGIEQTERKRHEEKIRQILLKKDTKLKFHFYYQGRDYEFIVNLFQDLYYTKKGNQFSRLDPCKCTIRFVDSQNEIVADSLNQAFVKMSVKYRPKNRTHTCNVFKTFYYERRKLDDLRKL